jgi:pimeloyl-ACP methyl ester carboxylesterase
VRELDVVGHSFGGGVAQMLLMQPELRVRRLVLLASGGLGRDIGIWLRLATLPAVEHLGQRFMTHGLRLVLRHLQGSLSASDIEQLSLMSGREHTARAFARSLRDVVDLRGQRRAFAHYANQIGELPPVMVCWGDRDELIPIEHGIDFAKTVAGVHFHCVQGAGHWPHHDQPDAVVAALDAFLRARRGPVQRHQRHTAARAARYASLAALVAGPGPERP